MRIFKFLFPILVLAVGAGTFAYFQSTREEPEPLKPRSQAPLVSVEPVRITNTRPMTRLFGSVETPNFGLLTAAVEADINEVRVLEGDSVSQGDVLVILDDTDITLQLLQRKAELAEIEALIESDKIRHQADISALASEKTMLALVRKSVERAQTLAESRTGSQATLDDALQNEQRQILAIILRQQSINDFPSRQLQLEARKQKAKASLSRAERDMSRTRISAPFDGRIAQVMVSPGDRVGRGGQLLNLYDASRLELRVQVPSSFVPALQRAIDDKVSISAFAHDNGKEIELEFHRLSALVEQGQGGVDAFFRTPDGQLPALGTTLAIWVYLPVKNNVVLVSPDAIYNRTRVYVVQDDELQSRDIQTAGERVDDDGRQMILLDGKDFTENELVMTSRLPQAVSGLKVKVSIQD